MNSLLHSSVFFIFAVSAVGAETSPPSRYEVELKQLGLQRDKAVADVVAPINRRYKDSLEQLQKRATQAGDLDAALKIKAELQQVPAPVDTSQPAMDAKMTFVGKKWLWCTSADPKAPGHGTIEFIEGGALRKSGEVASFLAGWESLPNGDVKVNRSGGGQWVFKFDPIKNEARSLKARGSNDNEKWLRPIKPTDAPGKPAAPVSNLRTNDDSDNTAFGRRVTNKD